MANNPTHAEVSQPPRPEPQRDLAAELAAQEEEVLRLRNLLIDRDRELGQARGRLTMIEQSSRRLGEAAARIPIPGATRLLQGLIRLVQRALQ